MRVNPLKPQAWIDRALATALPEARISSQSGAATTNFFAHALSLRPHSGALWARYADFTHRRGAPARETIDKLDKAIFFAPSWSYVRRAELRIGFSYWDDLDELQRARLISSVGNLLQHDLRSVIASAVEYDWSDKLRPLLKNNGNIRRLDRALAEKAKRKALET